MKKFYKKIKNLFRWIPVIWKDRQHDHTYISVILIKKLEITRDFFLSSDTHLENSIEVAQEISTVIELLKRTQDSFEHYDSKALDDVEKKWGKSKVTFVEIQDGLYESKVEIEGVKTQEDRLEYEKDLTSKLEVSRKLYMKDKVKAWTMIAENIDKWWD